MRLEILREGALAELAAQGIGAGENIGHGNVILLERALNLRFHDGGGKSRDDGRNAAEQRFVNSSGLREIGGLGGAARIGERGQKIILHDRAQQNVGAELLWMRTNSTD